MIYQTTHLLTATNLHQKVATLSQMTSNLRHSLMNYKMIGCFQYDMMMNPNRNFGYLVPYYMIIYYIDTSVLLGTKPLVDSIRHCIRDPSGVFSV